MDYYSKYLKYKSKYLDLKNQLGKGYKAKGKEIPCEQFSSQISAKDYNSSCPDTQPNKPLTKTKEYDQFIKDLKVARELEKYEIEKIFSESWKNALTYQNIPIDDEFKQKVKDSFVNKAIEKNLKVEDKYYNLLLKNYESNELAQRIARTSSGLKSAPSNSPKSPGSKSRTRR